MRSLNCTEERTCTLCGTTFLFNATPSKVKAGQGVFCSGICQRRGRRQRQQEDSFRARVGQQTASGCILWVGATDKAGYGRLGNALAHRIAWELYHGPIPEGSHILHKCDVPACVNPEHLFLGTNQDNIDDKMNKDRQAKGSMFNRKLTELDVSKILARTEPQALIAKDFGVDQSLISRILNRKRWKHVS
jgi:hypothetical protein